MKYEWKLPERTVCCYTVVSAVVFNEIGQRKVAGKGNVFSREVVK